MGVNENWKFLNCFGNCRNVLRNKVHSLKEKLKIPLGRGDVLFTYLQLVPGILLHRGVDGAHAELILYKAVVARFQRGLYMLHDSEIACVACYTSQLSPEKAPRRSSCISAEFGACVFSRLFWSSNEQCYTRALNQVIQWNGFSNNYLAQFGNCRK